MSGLASGAGLREIAICVCPLGSEIISETQMDRTATAQFELEASEGKVQEISEMARDMVC